MELSTFLINIIPALIVGIALAWFNREQRLRDEAAVNREKNRLKAERVRISLLVASAKLSYATAIAMKRGHANGEVEDGIKQYEEAIKEFKRFERELVARQSLEE